MKLILNDAEVADAIAHMRNLLDQTAQEHAKLRDLRRHERDGYPTRSLGGGAGGPTNEIDDDGTPVPQHSDPVGRLVAELDEHRDPVGNALAQLVQHVHRARRELEAAVGSGRKVELPQKPDVPHDEIWCENCLRRASVKTPREEGRKVCRWCRDEKAEFGVYPSRRLIEAHTRGRVTGWLRAQIRARDREDLVVARAARKARKAALKGGTGD